MKNFKQIFKEAENAITGIAAAPGIVIAKAYLFTKEKLEINDGDISNIEEAKSNLVEALAKSKKELNKIFAIAKDASPFVKFGIISTALEEGNINILP